MATRPQRGYGMRVGTVGDGRTEPGFGGGESDLQQIESQFRVLDFDRLGIDQTSFAWQNLMGQSAIDTWTPVSSAETNCSTTMSEAMYIDFGPGVLCFGRMSIDAVLTATATSFEMSLPVDTEFANVGQLSGIAVNGNVASLTARILGNTANDTAEVNFVSSDINDRVFSFFFAYMKNKG